ncbi:MAG: hypothetical protein LBH56_01640, partial [Coriobacteriales bacterium]|nr:hypothetical protein [Coriobacteriales bacterium]
MAASSFNGDKVGTAVAECCPAAGAAAGAVAGMPAAGAAAGVAAGAASNATFIEGGLGAVKGLRCAGISAGFRRNPERRDLALIVTEKPAVAAGVFTQNLF